VDQRGGVQQGELAATAKFGVRQLSQVVVQQVEQLLDGAGFTPPGSIEQ
jgi:hypothetical protein